ncbi:MAG: ABC transporter substrate-binding protein, partial [Dehalococcoidia bacterium]|nr:ABC transporter substrate-binding protein [Dehalococcoidia bacterium]
APAATPTPSVAPTTAAKTAVPAPTATLPPQPTATATKRPLEKVTFNQPTARGIGMIAYFVGLDKGYYQEEGLDVNLQEVASAISVKSLIAGGQDFEGSLGSSKAAILQGAPLKGIFIGRVVNPFYLVTKPEIKTFADLKGKRIGVAAVGSALDIATSVVLRKNGLDPQKDVAWVGLGPGSSRFNAIKGGAIEAVVVEELDTLMLQAAGFNLLLFVGKEIPGASSGVAVNEKTLKERPNIIKSMTRAMVKSQKFIKGPQGKDYVVKRFTGFDLAPDLAAKLYDTIKDSFTEGGWVDDAFLKADLDRTREELKVAEDFSVDRVYDLTFAKQASQDLANWKP